MTKETGKDRFTGMAYRPAVIDALGLDGHDCVDVFRYLLEQRVVSALPDVLGRNGLDGDDGDFIRQLKDELTETVQAWIASDLFVDLLSDMTRAVLDAADMSADRETPDWLREMLPGAEDRVQEGGCV